MSLLHLDFLNTLLALIGITGWSWVWCLSKYKTGCDLRTQIGIIIFGAVWIVLVLADTVQSFQPTSLTVLTRALVLIGLWCCMPLLKKHSAELNKQKLNIENKGSA